MTYTAIILSAAKAAGVPGVLLLAICTHESSLTNIMVPHDGDSASYGLCQIKESTARSLGFKGSVSGPLKFSPVFPNTMEPVGKAEGLMVPQTNAKYAAKYLKLQLQRYNGDFCMATAAYNAGTYSPSTKKPGKPRNYKYIEQVILHLDEQYKDFLMCGPREVEVE